MHYLYYYLCASAGATIGYVVAAMMFAARNADTDADDER